MRERYKLQKWLRRVETVLRRVHSLAEEFDEAYLHDSMINAALELDDVVATIKTKLAK